MSDAPDPQTVVQNLARKEGRGKVELMPTREPAMCTDVTVGSTDDGKQNSSTDFWHLDGAAANLLL